MGFCPMKLQCARYIIHGYQRLKTNLRSHQINRRLCNVYENNKINEAITLASIVDNISGQTTEKGCHVKSIFTRLSYLL